MQSVRFVVCFFVVFGSVVLAAQSNPFRLTNQPASGKASSATLKPAPKNENRILESYGKLPLSFEANQGQADAQVRFLSRGSGYTLFLTGDEAVFSLRGRKVDGEALPASPRLKPTVVARADVVRMRLVKANPAATVTGEEELRGKSNYFIGNDPKKWRSNVPTYAKVRYERIYSGVDLVYYGNQRQLEYDFIVAPGADPHRIQFNVQGAKNINQDSRGELVLEMAEGEVRWRNPVVYQEKDGTRHEIAAHYAIKDKSRIGFEVADYDSRRPLFIDPLVYSTYLGGSGDDDGVRIAVDSAGNAYVAGDTTSTNFPTMNPLQSAYGGGNWDAYVSKINPAGSALVYSTYLGGSGADQGFGIAADSSGNAYVTGYTDSTDFPTMNPLQATNGGSQDAFVAQINPSGSALVYSTYLGGSGGDVGTGIAVDSSGDAYITGYTGSTNFPTMNPLQPTYGGDSDAFVSEINPTGSALLYSTYLGGSGGDYGHGIAVDGSGNAYVTGATTSTDFPTKNPLQPSNGGSVDAFVSQLNPAGSALVYSTYLGGSDSDDGSSIAVDGSGNAYVTGVTSSTNFPTMNPLQPANGGGQDAFVSKINPEGSAFVYSTYLGGSGQEEGEGIAVDSSGNAYVTGNTTSTNFPTMNPLQPANGGGQDAFISKLNPAGSALLYSTYLGGSGYDWGFGIAADSSDNGYITGSTTSTNFPTMNPLQPANGGSTDAWVAKLNITPSAAVSLSPPNLNFGDQTVGITSSPLVSTLTNIGELALTITSIQVTGTNSSDFAEKNNCPSSLAPTKSCQISVTFTPSGTGAENAAVTITDNAPNSPQSLPLTGVGVLPAVTFSPASLTFQIQVVFTSSPAQKVMLTNTGAGVLTINQITMTGPFSQTNNCPSSLNPNGYCTISVKFHPKNKGVQNGSVNVADNAPGSPQQVPLTGTGTFVQLLPANVRFGTQPVGTRSVPKTITLTNKGNSTVTFTGISITGTDAGDFAETNTCGKHLASGVHCFIKVTFKPVMKGKRTADVSVSDDGGGSPQKVGLTGTGT